MAKRTKATGRMAAILLIFGSFITTAFAQKAASARLSIYGNVSASYRVEVTGEGYTSIGQGLADGNSLRASVLPGPVAVRVLKANSRSATYTVVVSGGSTDVKFQGFPYDATIPVVIPDSTANRPLTLYVRPD